MGLNAEQQFAVECNTNLLVLAPPGSGKTGTLVKKTEHILSMAPQNKVLLVTFTDASAKEAKERILKAIGPKNASRVLVSTFHSHAIDQLRRGKQLGRILTPAESTTLVKQAVRHTGSTMDPFEAEAHVQGLKSNPNFKGDEDELVAAYEEMKRSHRALDLQDVIRECVNGMRATTQEQSLPPLPCTHVLCDEFQDVDWNQLNWLLAHMEKGAVLTAVGDDDQSIYGWRSSLGFEAVEAFIKATSPTVVKLEVNYRSHSEILLCADAVIRNNAMRMPKNLISFKGNGGRVSRKAMTSKDDEADYVLNLIEEDVVLKDGSKHVSPGRWGIIARNNRDLWFIAGKLRQAGIPVKASKKDPAPPEVMGFCSFLTSLCTNETIGLRKTLDDIGISFTSVNAVQAAMAPHFHSIMDNKMPQLDLPIEDRKPLKEFAALCGKWRRLLEMEQPAYSRVIAACGDWYSDSVKMSEESKADFVTFVGMLAGFRGSITNRIQSFFRPTESKNEAGVTILTMHGSKGLEFDRVYLAQCNVGTIPSPKTHSIEEERRLFYVAMTRARQDLHIGWIAAKGASTFTTEF